jgi:uncharacterized coiled-coil protein SlyX
MEHSINELAKVIYRILQEIDEKRTNHNTHAILDRIAEMEKKIMATQKELADDLKLVLAEQQKTAEEIKAVQASVDTLNAKIVDLEGQLASGSIVSQELIDAVAAVKAQAQIVDDLIPDSFPAPAPAT